MVQNSHAGSNFFKEQIFEKKIDFKKKCQHISIYKGSRPVSRMGKGSRPVSQSGVCLVV